MLDMIIGILLCAFLVFSITAILFIGIQVMDEELSSKKNARDSKKMRECIDKYIEYKHGLCSKNDWLETCLHENVTPSVCELYAEMYIVD